MGTFSRGRAGMTDEVAAVWHEAQTVFFADAGSGDPSLSGGGAL